jgi:thioredoxin 1
MHNLLQFYSESMSAPYTDPIGNERTYAAKKGIYVMRKVSASAASGWLVPPVRVVILLTESRTWPSGRIFKQEGKSQTMSLNKFQQLLQSGKPVLVDFSAEWCGPCKMMTPVLQELKGKTGESLTIIKVDVDKNPVVASNYQIQGVPTLILFRNGEIKWRQSGVQSADQILSTIRTYLS